MILFWKHLPFKGALQILMIQTAPNLCFTLNNKSEYKRNVKNDPFHKNECITFNDHVTAWLPLEKSTYLRPCNMNDPGAFTFSAIVRYIQSDIVNDFAVVAETPNSS